ncbi:hypothetical protein N7490_011602 [Penicillium lividum]|nr:hypothetical protein N7490_011602 [Penicillium lividum]
MATIDPKESELRLLSSVASTSVEAPNQKSPSSVTGWPHRAAKLRNNACSDKMSTLVDLILACVPLAFLVFAILAIRLNKDEISSYGEEIVQAAKLSPSIFPIVFAAIAGNMLRNYALWRAEHCAPLGLLEQLNRSTSMAGTVASIFSTGHVGPLTIAVLLLWAMSPIGGQSALRMLTSEATSVHGNTPVAYLNVVNASSWFDGASGLGSSLGAANSIYTTSLMTTQAVQSSPRDVWTFPKIPVLRHLPLNTSSSSSNPWRTCDHNNQTVYSSLIGLVVGGIPSDSEADFSVETSYFDLDCHAKAQNISDDSLFAEMGGSLLLHNATDLFSIQSSDSVPNDGDNSFFIDTSYNFTASRLTQPQINLWYGTWDTISGVTLNASLYNCTLSTVRVEAWISCQNASCAVVRMRRSQKDTRPASLSPFNGGESDWETLISLMSHFPSSTGYTHPDHAQATDNYIYGQYPVFRGIEYVDHNWSSISDEAVSSRFTSAFNTYWQASLSPFTIGSTLPTQAANTSTADGDLSYFNMTTATTSRSIRVYQIEWAWAITFILAAVLLQLCAFIGLFFKFQTIAPDLLGFVSSMTRDNPYIHLPSGGTNLSGSERAKLLRDLPVQILDVDCQNDTGYIALGSAAEGKLAYQRLNRQRRYR